MNEQPPLHEIARQTAESAVSVAVRLGYQLLPNRAAFFRSDLMELEGEILHWLINHMRPESAGEAGDG